MASGVNQLVTTLKRKLSNAPAQDVVLDTESSQAPLLSHEVSPPHMVVSERK